jgi:hypothetical protein
LYISFESSGKADLELSVVNTLGQEIYYEDLGAATGAQHMVLNMINYPDGVYYVQLKSDDGIAIRKIVVN